LLRFLYEKSENIRFTCPDFLRSVADYAFDGMHGAKADCGAVRYGRIPGGVRAFGVRFAVAGCCVPAVPGPLAAGEICGASPSTVPESPGAAFKFEEITFSKGGISIKYPQITEAHDAAKAEQINKLIADSALRDLSAIENDQDLDVYELTGKVSLPGQKVVSVSFEGYANYKMAAHPYQFIYTVTIDAEKLQTGSLQELINVSKEFIPVFTNGTYSATGYEITDEIKAQIRDFLDDFDVEYWVGEHEKSRSGRGVHLLLPDAGRAGDFRFCPSCHGGPHRDFNSLRRL
jgi:hypothetical protein